MNFYEAVTYEQPKFKEALTRFVFDPEIIPFAPVYDLRMTSSHATDLFRRRVLVSQITSQSTTTLLRKPMSTCLGTRTCHTSDEKRLTGSSRQISRPGVFRSGAKIYHHILTPHNYGAMKISSWTRIMSGA